MLDRAFFLSLQAVRCQLAALPNDLYLVRLIHHTTHRPFPGERLWTAGQLTRESTLRFLRIRNRDGCDVYIQPYAGNCNAGYTLVDLDHGQPAALDRMRANGHEPCLVLQTSPGRLQAWIRVSATPLEPAIASSVGKQLALTYGGDLASTDWRHLGRLAGFTNQKPTRRQPNGYAPWVQVLHTQVGFATHGAALIEAARRQVARAPHTLPAMASFRNPRASHPVSPDCDPAVATQIYAAWLDRLRIPQRFPQTDWSIADKWIAKELLRQGACVSAVEAVLRCASPSFPRCHGHPDDYLRRTLARALRELGAPPFPAPAPRAPCVQPD